MNLFVKGLPPETQILIATGAAIAAGCQQCLKQLVSLGENEALEKRQMRAAAAIGQFIKDRPANEMNALAQSLLGGDPGAEADQAACACSGAQTAEAGCCG